MARRYTRDNRGRFSSTGATARGGRLRTAAGNKRATQTTKLSGGKASGTISKPKGLKPGAIKAKPQVSSGRQAATDRLKVKTQTRRAMRADRGSVVTPGQRSRLEAGRGATMAGARPASTVAKPRTTGNTKQQVASRVERKLAAERARMNIINRAERVGATQGNQRERSYKRQATLERAQTFLKTGKLPGKDNSIAAQRSMRQAKERLAAKNAARAAALKPAATTRKEQLAAGAQRRNAQADRIDAKVKALEGQYRSKDAAFYTQGAKPAGRDRMIAKSQQAAQLREQSAALRTKAANAEKMSTQTKGTAASKKQERRNDFDAAGYKVGDTVTTRQYGTQKITKISKNSVSFDKGNTQDKAFMANYLQLQAKPANPASTARQGAPKPARSRSVVGRIDGAKADRIIQRHDAMRPGLRPATGSKARSMNSINTFLRARKFLLEPSRKVAKKGETISGQESIRRAVAGASKKARKRK